MLAVLVQSDHKILTHIYGPFFRTHSPDSIVAKIPGQADHRARGMAMPLYGLLLSPIILRVLVMK
jgi:hypothetical protein